MVCRFATTLGRFDEDGKARLDLFLAKVVIQPLGAQASIPGKVIFLEFGGKRTILRRHGFPFASFE
jgi:hypothetical protein